MKNSKQLTSKFGTKAKAQTYKTKEQKNSNTKTELKTIKLEIEKLEKQMRKSKIPC